MLSWLQLLHPALRAFDRHRVGIAGARFDSGDIALFFGIGVLPQGQRRQLVGVEGDGHALVAGTIHQGGQGLAGAVGIGGDVEHLLVEAAGRPLVALPCAQPGLGIVVERRHLPRRRQQARALFEDRPPEVAVVDDLVVLGIVAGVAQHVVDGERVAARDVAQFGPGFEVRLLEAVLLEQPAHADRIWRVLVDVHDHLGGGRIAGAAMQGIQHALRGDRMAGPFIAATHQHLVEAFQPAQAVAAFQGDAIRIDHLIHRGVPAQADALAGDVQQAHAAGRAQHDDQAVLAADGDDLAAFLAAAVQHALFDAEVVLMDSQRLAVDAPVALRLVGLRVGQHDAACRRRGGQQQRRGPDQTYFHLLATLELRRWHGT